MSGKGLSCEKYYNQRNSGCSFKSDDVIFALQRVHLDIQVGEHTNDYSEIAAKDKLTELQLRIRQLLDQVEQIGKEQAYQRVSEVSLNTACQNLSTVY